MKGICEHCGKLIDLEKSNVEVGWVWHGYCCGWNQTPAPMTDEESKNINLSKTNGGSMKQITKQLLKLIAKIEGGE